MFSSNSKELKVLSFSGGAEKGEFSIRIAKALNDKLKIINSNKELVEYFHVITGNSIGSILSSCLIIPSDKNKNKPKHSLDECIKIFDNDLHNINSNIGLKDKIKLFLNLKNHILTKKDVDFIHKMCGNTKLSETVVPVVITSTNALNAQPRLWSSYDAKNDPKKDFYLKDAIEASISYPGLFNSKKTIFKGDIYHDFDGGLIAATPLITALPHILKNNNKYAKDKAVVVSVGTTTGNTSNILHEIDNSSFEKNIYNIYLLSSQIQKIPFDSLFKTFIPNYYKLDFMIPQNIQHSIYFKASK
ncbi:hypothetical protein TRIADDRAFT_62987, partial [Trichoplax adhaerens]